MNKNKIASFCLVLILLVSQSCKKDTNLISKQIADNSSIEELSMDAVALDTTLLCYLPFTNNLKDKSGNNNNGILVGTVSYVADRFGNASKAVSFSASNSYIEIPETQFVGLRAVTIAMDFFPTPTGTQQLISKMSYSDPIGSAGFYQSFTCVIEEAGLIGFAVRQANYCNSTVGSGWNPTTFANTAVIYNAWNHMAIAFTDNIQKMYLNGILVGVDVKTSSPICSGGPIRLGVWWQDGPFYFTGNMDEVRIYKRVLSGGEIRKLSRK